MNDRQKHQQCTNRFIEVANKLKDEGFDINLVSAALMSASAVYATFSVAGNTGGLTPSGVDKVVDAYRKSLENIQSAKKAAAEKANQAATDS